MEMTSIKPHPQILGENEAEMEERERAQKGKLD